MELNMINEGFKLMALGMSTVFLFLLLMVIILQLQAKVINRYFPEKPKTPTKANTGAKASNDGAIVAAIIAAVTKFEKDK